MILKILGHQFRLQFVWAHFVGVFEGKICGIMHLDGILLALHVELRAGHLLEFSKVLEQHENMFVDYLIKVIWLNAVLLSFLPEGKNVLCVK